MNGLQRLYSGDFNSMQVECLPDGTQRITLVKDGDSIVHRFRVKNLYQVNEELLKHEEIIVKIPKHIKKRMKEAKQNG